MEIAIIDDCGMDRFLTRNAILQDYPRASVVEYATPDDALAAARDGELASLVLLDLRLGGTSGLDVALRLLALGEFDIVLHSDHLEPKHRARAEKLPNVLACLEKTADGRSVRQFLASAEPCGVSPRAA